MGMSLREEFLRRVTTGMQRNVAAMFVAKTVTAASSTTADTGSQAHARTALPWYARIWAATRIVQPTVSVTRASAINRELKSLVRSVKVGSIRGATLKTIVVRHPTVSA